MAPACQRPHQSLSWCQLVPAPSIEAVDKFTNKNPVTWRAGVSYVVGVQKVMMSCGLFKSCYTFFFRLLTVLCDTSNDGTIIVPMMLGAGKKPQQRKCKRTARKHTTQQTQSVGLGARSNQSDDDFQWTNCTKCFGLSVTLPIILLVLISVALIKLILWFTVFWFNLN